MTDSLIGLIGVLVGASITWWMTSQFEKRRNAVTLYAEFSTPDMEACRDEALRTLRNNYQSPNPLSFQDMFEQQVNPNDLVAVSRFVHFWEKTWYLSRSNYTDSRLTKEFLRHYFESHYQKYLIDFALLCDKRDDATYQRWVIAVRNLANLWGIAHISRAKKNPIQN